MPVPYIFANTPGGSSLLLSELDSNFAYVLAAPSFTGNVAVGGNLSVTGTSSLSGPVTVNDITINGALTIDGQTINPTGLTGSGLIVLNTGPTLVAPILGTPASGNLSNCTNFPVSALSGTSAGIINFLSNPTSTNLAAAVVDETGSGNLVFSDNATLNSPTLVTPALGTPTSGDLFACIGYDAANLSGVVATANGGTGLSTVGAVGSVLTVTSPGVLGYATASAASSVAGGVASELLYQSAPNTTAFVPNGIAGQALLSNGAAAPAWGQINLTAAVTNVLPIANGGTSGATQQTALNNLAGSTTTAYYLRGDGTNVAMSPIIPSDVPTLNQNTTGSAATFTSTTQDSRFNSIGVGVNASTIAGDIRTIYGVTFSSTTTQTDAALGYGQSWQNVTATRAAGTTYTNTTTKPIMVEISLTSTGATDTGNLKVGGVTVAIVDSSPAFGTGTVPGSISSVIPVGATYVLTFTVGAFTINAWAELR